jgi:GntR family transcriptional regulator, rspAB operon transcriptional repressor
MPATKATKATSATTASGAHEGQHVGLVHERLRAAILRGEIPAGATTSQAALAKELDAGPTPLREALRMLQREGLVISEPNRRVRIAELSSEDAEELYIMRISLEAVAIRITVPKLKSADFAALEGYMAQMDHYMRTHDNPGMRQPHHEFHQLLVAGAGPRVSDMIGQLFDHAERYRVRYGATRNEVWEERRAEHRAIVDAAAAGDPDLAALRLTEHYSRTAALIFAALDPDHDLERLRTTIETVAPGAGSKLTVS